MGFTDTLDLFTEEITYDEPMKKHTAFGVGGPARYFSAVRSLYTLNSLICSAREHGIPYRVLGNGTNVLVSDKGYDGLIITTQKLKDIFISSGEVKAMAGATLGELMRFCLRHRMTGLEAVASIPATVGGAVVMNAGAFGYNVSDYITSVETVADGKLKKYYKQDCKFSYRKSRFCSCRETVTAVNFDFLSGEREIIEASARSYAEIRKKSQPVGRTCGSVFKNPPKDFAGRLIEQAGLKGFSIGGAVVSEKHANFILNEKSAQASDIYNLIRYIKHKVKDTFDISLKEEVEYVGEF